MPESDTIRQAPLPNEDTDYVSDLARSMYLHFCRIRGYDPQPPPYAPSWTLDYARIAIKFQRDAGPYTPLTEE